MLSFHGVPRRSPTLGDPYHCQCLKTARLLGERLSMPTAELVVTFQSRFGKAEWLAAVHRADAASRSPRKACGVST